MKAISLFSGIGGLDFGFEEAGFSTRVALEMSAHCCRAIRRNRPSWEIIEDDVNLVQSSDILRRAGLAVGEADVLIGGPPCQPFSKSSYWVKGDTARLDDPRAETLRGYLNVLRDTQPRAFLLGTSAGWFTRRRMRACDTSWTVLPPLIASPAQTITLRGGSSIRPNTVFRKFGRERSLSALGTDANSGSPYRRTATLASSMATYSQPASRLGRPGTPLAACRIRGPTNWPHLPSAANGATCYRPSPKVRTISGIPTVGAD